MHLFNACTTGRSYLAAAFVLLALILSSCDATKKDAEKKEEKKEKNTMPAETATPPVATSDLAGVLSLYALDEKKPDKWKLPERLSEISGIAFSPDGRLFAHGDESAVVYQIDTSSGEVVNEFNVGGGVLGGAMSGDFEDIAIVGDMFYLVQSNGTIVEFKEYRKGEGENEKQVRYQEYETPLKSKNDVEGLCYDEATNALLLLCKADPGKGVDNGMRAVYSFSLATKELDPKPRFLIPADEVMKQTGGTAFNPSAITHHPRTGTFLVLASVGNALVELSPDGKILGVVRLDGDVHPQPEGIAVSPGGRLYISDEGRGGKGRISSYAMRGR
jgi:uncharacterized protein YjiK